MEKNFFAFFLFIGVTHCLTISKVCSPPPDNVKKVVQDCFKEHMDLDSFGDYAENPNADKQRLNKFNACNFKGLDLMFDGKMNYGNIEAFFNKWVLNKESAKNINEFLKIAAEEANQEDGELRVAHKFFVIVNTKEMEKSFINSEFCQFEKK